MSERGRNRYDADRAATIEDELAFALRSLDDLEQEHESGQLSDEQFERLHSEYVVRAAESARRQRHEAKLKTRATPHRARFRAPRRSAGRTERRNRRQAAARSPGSW